MKNILIITYHFLKEEEIGSQRIRGLYRNLPSFGWKPIVVTSSLTEYLPKDKLDYVYPLTSLHPFLKIKKIMGFPDNKGIINEISERYVPCSSVEKKNRFQRIIIRCTEFLSFPDFSSYWVKPAIKQAEKLIMEQKIDLIFSTYGPSGCHIVGSYLSQKYKIPWIADYRDLWCDNPVYSYSKARKKIESSYEEKILFSSDYITTVSKPLINQLKKRFNDKPIESIPNGFDERILLNISKPENFFSIVYTGRLYQGKRDPEPLFHVLSRLIKNRDISASDIRIYFYGDNDLWLIQMVNDYHLQDIVSFYGHVNRADALYAQKTAQILLLLTWNDPEQEGIITGKVYEYLASGRPILAIGHNNEKDLKYLLEKTGTGVHVTSNELLEKYLFNTYKEFISCGSVSYSGQEKEIMKYSHYEMTRNFVRIFSKIERENT